MPAEFTSEYVARFWSHVDKSGGPDACWPWTGYRDKYGYGHTRLPQRGTDRGAHRIAWMIEHGTIPGLLLVCHHCDNPPCCNPSHFFLGTNQDNHTDMDAKGRRRSVMVGSNHWTHTNPEKRATGMRHGRAKLTDAEVLEIRADYAKGTLQRELAARYGLSRPTISIIVTGKVWKHLIPQKVVADLGEAV